MSVGQRGALAGDFHLGRGKRLVPQKTVRAAADFVPAVGRVFVQETVQVVTHESRMVVPAVGGIGTIVVAVEEAGPLAVHATPREADGLGAQPGDGQARHRWFRWSARRPFCPRVCWFRSGCSYDQAKGVEAGVSSVSSPPRQGRSISPSCLASRCLKIPRPPVMLTTTAHHTTMKRFIVSACSPRWHRSGRCRQPSAPANIAAWRPRTRNPPKSPPPCTRSDGSFPLNTAINQFQGVAPAATLTAPPAGGERHYQRCRSAQDRAPRRDHPSSPAAPSRQSVTPTPVAAVPADHRRQPLGQRRPAGAGRVGGLLRLAHAPDQAGPAS